MVFTKLSLAFVALCASSLVPSVGADRGSPSVVVGPATAFDFETFFTSTTSVKVEKPSTSSVLSSAASAKSSFTTSPSFNSLLSAGFFTIEASSKETFTTLPSISSVFAATPSGLANFTKAASALEDVIKAASTKLASATQTSIKPSSTAVLNSTTLAASCPSGNGTIITTACGATYAIQCSTDHSGGDMGKTASSSLQSCIATCDATNGCAAISFIPGSPTGRCYYKKLKNLGPPKYSADVHGARQLTACKVA
ncbi:hypothetical protein LTR60_004040 [Cryomyces antarcticus]|nr:hypothetical protein LTR60_004040 [Cryomyces antarcticus]KAK5013940.1 hypothetical protein LTR39_003402 [Cryomyces antarcticus]